MLDGDHGKNFMPAESIVKIINFLESDAIQNQDQRS
jgi:hypothetical protein